MKPYATANHRFGNVFLRIVRMSKAGRVTVTARINPAEAKRLGEELVRLSERATPRKLRLKPQ